MTTTTYGLLLSVITCVLCTTKTLSDLNRRDLHALMYVCAMHQHDEALNTNTLLCEFKKRTHLNVSHNDLLTYFSNLGIKVL